MAISDPRDRDEAGALTRRDSATSARSGAKRLERVAGFGASSPARPRIRRQRRGAPIVAMTATLPYGDQSPGSHGTGQARAPATAWRPASCDWPGPPRDAQAAFPSSTPLPTAARSIAGSASKTAGAFNGCIRRERTPRGSGDLRRGQLASRVRAHASTTDWPALCAYDAAAFGADAQRRCSHGLRGRLPAAELIAERAGRIVGLHARPRRACSPAHLGPLVAEDDGIACALLARAHRCDIDGPLFIDARGRQDRSCAAFSQATRLRPRRGRSRAWLYGTSARFDDPARTFAVVGPEFG